MPPSGQSGLGFWWLSGAGADAFGGQCLLRGPGGQEPQAPPRHSGGEWNTQSLGSGPPPLGPQCHLPDTDCVSALVCQVSLNKVGEYWWSAILEGEEQIDIDEINKERSMATVDEEEHAVLDRLTFDYRQKLQGKPQSHELVRAFRGRSGEDGACCCSLPGTGRPGAEPRGVVHGAPVVSRVASWHAGAVQTAPSPQPLQGPQHRRGSQAQAGAGLTTKGQWEESPSKSLSNVRSVRSVRGRRLWRDGRELVTGEEACA